MDPVRAPVPVTGGARVQERAAGGRRGDPEAFRRALQEGAAQRRDDEPEPAVRTTLQPGARIGRRNPHPAAGHVDVLA